MNILIHSNHVTELFSFSIYCKCQQTAEQFVKTLFLFLNSCQKTSRRQRTTGMKFRESYANLLIDS